MLPGQNVATIDEGQLKLWFASPDELACDSLKEICGRLLSEDERARSHRFRSERRRCEYLTTRVLIRTALSHYHPLAPEAWRFRTNFYGKPEPDIECGLRFNLSNSHRLVACLISKGIEVGIDVEPYEHAEEIADLAPDVFSELERGQLASLTDPERLDMALSLWTLKEAYVKAEGTGLNLPMNKITFMFGGEDEIRLQLDPDVLDKSKRLWHFCLLDYDGHRIAVMADMPAVPELHQFVVKPVLAYDRNSRGNELSTHLVAHSSGVGRDGAGLG
jgi:4'-phosphopantetheinyl transferase